MRAEIEVGTEDNHLREVIAEELLRSGGRTIRKLIERRVRSLAEADLSAGLCVNVRGIKQS